jgi:hypothetical protein
VSIVAQCPHCETRFNLQAEMNGKSMRCPNLECRQVFNVQAMQEKGPAPVYELPPEPVPPPPPAKPTKPAASKPPKPIKAPKSAEPEVVEAKVVEAAVVSPPKMKEVVWSEDTDVPPVPGKKGRKPVKPDAVDELPVRRKRKHSRRPMLLAGLLVGIVALAGFGIFYVIYFQTKNEEKLAKQAEDEYGKGNYGDAAKTYDKLVKEYADSKDIDKYKFFADLASMQTVVRGVTNRENYDAAVNRLQEFITTHKDAPLAKPTSGYGRDVLEAGKKLGEDIAAHAEDRVKAFQTDRAKNSGELARADKAIAAGRALVPVLDPFRAADDPPLEKLLAAYDRAEKGVKRERDRTAAINRARADLDNPSDAVIQRVEADLQSAGFLDDPESQTLIAAAKGKLRDLVRYEDDPAVPQPAPPTAAASLLFVTPIGKTRAHEPAAGDPPATAFLCVARGILYALDEDTGALLWAARVGPDVTDPPAVARVELASGLTDLAVVTSNVGNAPAVSGHVLRSGETRWYQPLPAPAAGPAVVVGGRAFVPVRDPLGTVYEFDLTTGNRVGRIRLGQLVADRGAVLRPGTGYLYVAADARRLYVIDTGGKDDDGNRVNPRCVQVIATGHLAGTLRVPPLFIGPGGTDPADRWMILAQAEGTAKTLLRAFPVGPVSAPPVDGSTVPETPAVPTVSVPVPGWVSFSPVSDGERLAVISDTGQFRLFGVNQMGNSDKPLFPLAALAGSGGPADRPIPGLMIPVEEATYWLVAAGQLQKARLALVPSKGQEVVLSGAPLPVGEPVHAAQVNARRDVACVVVRSLNSSGCRAVAFDLRGGEVRWQRQLGLVPAKMSADQFAAPVAQGDHFVLVDEDGGIVAVPVASGVAVGQALAAPQAWVLAAAPANATGPTVVVATPDGKTVYTVTPVNRDGPKFVIRRVADGKLAHEDEVIAPAALGGQPAVVGDALLVPTADGFVNRFVPGDGRVRPGSLVAGPAWLGERKPALAVCSITPLSDSAFATSDGGKRLSRWDWPGGGKWNQPGTWELRETVAGPGVVVPPAEPGGPARFVVADVSGSVWLFAADRAGQPLRRWRPGAGPVPAGRPSSGFATQATEPGRVVVAYVVDGKTTAAIGPDHEDALWAKTTSEDASRAIVGTPQPAGANRWVVTDLAGRVMVIDGTTGDVLATQAVGLPGAVPAAASGVAANSALTPLSDGSAVVIELPKKESAAPPPKKE